jgi:pilus assembly protein CpaB
MRRSIISLFLGVVLAAAALFVLFTSKPTKIQAINMPTVPVMVALKDIDYGTKITPELVKIVQWPANSLPKGAITQSTEMFEGPNAPRIALRSMTANEIFLQGKVSGFGERPIMSRKVSEGMRAFSVRINDVSGVAGFILPGDRVDVMLTRSAENGGGRNELATEYLLQNIVVLGVNQDFSDNQEAPQVAKSATLEVTPEDAQKLALATQVGTLTLSLRNYATTEDEKTKRIGAGDLGEKVVLPAPAPKKAAPKPAPAPVDTSVYVKVRKGTDVKTEKVAN